VFPMLWGTCLEQRPAEKASGNGLTCGSASTPLRLPTRLHRSEWHAPCPTTDELGMIVRNARAGR
jgi:hypothetical protein